MATYRIVIDGFKSFSHAKAYASWFEGQGEQDATYWMEENDTPNYMVKDQQIDGNTIFVKVECK